MADTLVELLGDAVRRFGPRTALSITPGFRPQRWTYWRLWDFSGRVAGLLHQRGLRKGDRALIWAPNCPEWVVAFLGCLRAGVVLVPLDIRSAPDFVARVVAQTEPKLAFLSAQTAPHWPDTSSDKYGAFGLPTIGLEDLEELVEGVPPLGEEPPVAQGDIAELMFTSGTTGEPKGVILSHRNLVSNVLASRQVVPVRPRDRLLSLLPLSHMLEQTGGLLVPLYSGASIVYPVSRQPSIIFKTMQKNRVTNLVVVPQALQVFMNAIEREVKARGKERQWRLLSRLAARLPGPARRWLFSSVHRRLGGRLRLMMSGGAYLDPQLAQRWALLGVEVLQGYGATETSPVITTNSFHHQKAGSVGRVLPGQEVRIGNEGEVLTRGPNVTRGYWRNPEATASSFEDGWYKTGDLGYLDQDGFLYLQGRAKDLIVLPDGQKVYPEDVESLLHKQAGVRDAVVVGLPRDGGAVEVHAVLLMEDGSQAPAVVRAVNQLLSDRQRIQGYTLWPQEDFPRTHTLKVRKPLVLEHLLAEARQPQRGAAQGGPRPATVPLSDLQRVVASACSLPAQGLTPEKTLGGDLNLDSLGRVEMLSAIEEQLGVYVDEQQVGPETTLRELEALVQLEGAQRDLPFPGWGRRMWCRVLRVLLQYGVIFPLNHLLYKVKVQGREHLRGLEGPVLFAANHNITLDNPLIFMALPFRRLWRLSPAAAADVVFRSPFWRVAGPLLGNAFPFSREGAVRPSLEHLGQLLDWGWSVLIYPEGRLTRGEIKEFRAGTGLVAVGSRTPVVPVRVVLHKGSVLDGAWLLSRGDVEIRFGQPITFPPRMDYREATAQLEAAVRAL